MASENEIRLREVIASGLRELNEAKGGHHLSQVARVVGRHRSTVVRYARAEHHVPVDVAKILCDEYPQFFDWELIARLYAQASTEVGDHGALTVGLEATESVAELYRRSLESVQVEPAEAADREILLASLHLDHEGTTRPEPLLDDDTQHAIAAFQRAMAARAGTGWKTRVVVSCGTESRIASVRRLVNELRGPDVEVRAYPVSVPLVISPLVVGRRDVFLAVDQASTGRPQAAILLRSPSVMAWASDYFYRLFDDAPLRLRTYRGVNRADLAELERQVHARSAPQP